MENIMKIAMLIVRTLLGLLSIFSSIVYFFNLIEPPPMTGPIKEFNEGLAASGYFFPLLKATELVCGIALVAGRFVPLALVVLAPIVVNIFMVHFFVARSGQIFAVILVLAMFFLAYYYRDRYVEILKPN
jgi:putative oxidoreductase